MRFIKKITNQEYNDLTEWLGSNLVYNLLGNGWYLKQKEQKPVDFPTTDEEMKDFLDKTPPVEVPEKYKTTDWLFDKMRQKPAEWSEEDEDFINMLILHFNYLIDKGGDSVETYKSYKEKLKSLRPQWKPTEKDLMMLEHIIGQYEIGNKNCKTMGYLPRVEELNFLKKVLAKWKNLL